MLRTREYILSIRGTRGEGVVKESKIMVTNSWEEGMTKWAAPSGAEEGEEKMESERSRECITN